MSLSASARGKKKMDVINQVLLTYVLNAFWQIPLIAATAWLCLKLASRLSPTHHHAVWVAALVLSVVIPLSNLPGPKALRGLDNVSSFVVTGDAWDAHSFSANFQTSNLLHRIHHHGQTVPLAPLLKGTLAVLYIAFFLF